MASINLIIGMLVFMPHPPFCENVYPVRPQNPLLPMPHKSQLVKNFAAMIFGKWNPKGAIFASLLFAFGQVAADQMKASGVGVPQQFLTMIPYILTLLALVGFVGKAKAPKASGIPYEK